MKRLALLAVGMSAATAHAQADSAITWGRRYTDLFWDDHLSAISAHFTPKMHAAMDSAQFAAVREQIRGQLGAKQYVISETETPRASLTVYDQLVVVAQITQPVDVRWAFDSAGAIAGFFILPSPVTEAVSAFTDYQTKTALRLPFTGEWHVLWGGRSLAQNRYASSPDQRFAIDFGVGNGACSGRPVLAPGDGTIADRVDSANYIVIDHGNGEFSFLGNLQHGSIAVNTGQHVRQGDQLGRCGAYLHYHMQSTPSFMVGAGMPAQFQHYVADGTPIDRGEPIRGQVVRPAQ